MLDKKEDPYEDDFLPGEDITYDDRLILQRCFLYTDDGKQALRWLLLNLGLYKEVRSEGESANRSFALKILTTLGVMQQPFLEASIDHMGELVKSDALHPEKRYVRKVGRENVRHPES